MEIVVKIEMAKYFQMVASTTDSRDNTGRRADARELKEEEELAKVLAML